MYKHIHLASPQSTNNSRRSYARNAHTCYRKLFLCSGHSKCSSTRSGQWHARAGSCLGYEQVRKLQGLHRGRGTRHSFPPPLHKVIPSAPQQGHVNGTQEQGHVQAMDEQGNCKVCIVEEESDTLPLPLHTSLIF